jgi:hypothetical protein
MVFEFVFVGVYNVSLTIWVEASHNRSLQWVFLEEQQQYSRRTSLRFNNVNLPSDNRGQVIYPIDTEFVFVGVYNVSLTIWVEASHNRSLAISDLTNRMGSSNTDSSSFVNWTFIGNVATLTLTGLKMVVLWSSQLNSLTLVISRPFQLNLTIKFSFALGEIRLFKILINRHP